VSLTIVALAVVVTALALLALSGRREATCAPSLRTGSWRLVELASLLVGLVGTAALCLAGYGWHLSRESLFFIAWSATPYVLLALFGRIARTLLVSRAIRPVTALFAVAVSLLSLAAYGNAVLHPNHSSGMVFVILPLMWMIVVPLVTAGVVIVLRVARPR
jgi:hypothetical protein